MSGNFRAGTSNLSEWHPYLRTGNRPRDRRVELLDYTVVDDFGKVTIRCCWKGRSGVSVRGWASLADHAMISKPVNCVSQSDGLHPARADNMPNILSASRVPCTTNPLGIKGAGEAGAIGAPPAIVNAVVNALTPQGVKHVDMPLTPDTVTAPVRRIVSKQIQTGARLSGRGLLRYFCAFQPLLFSSKARAGCLRASYFS